MWQTQLTSNFPHARQLPTKWMMRLQNPVHDKQQRSSASGEESTQPAPSNTWMASHLILSERPGQVEEKDEGRRAVVVFICGKRGDLLGFSACSADTAVCEALTSCLTVTSWPLVMAVKNNSPHTNWTNLSRSRRKHFFLYYSKITIQSKT